MRIPQEQLEHFMKHDVQESDLSASEIVFVRYLVAERKKVAELQAQVEREHKAWELMKADRDLWKSRCNEPYDESVIAENIELQAQVAELSTGSLKGMVDVLHDDKRKLQAQIIRIYNSGYHAGHEDTVEGMYTDIYPCDMDTYHTEEVQELLEDLKGEKV